MTRPDVRQICEVTLTSFGYRDVQNLTNKILVFHRLGGELLSSEDHYDFGKWQLFFSFLLMKPKYFSLCMPLNTGLTNIKSTLLACRQQKILNPLKNENDQIITCLIAANASKLIPSDMPLFKQIISNLFGRIDFAKMPKSHADIRQLLHAKFVECCTKAHLQPLDAFFDKVMDMYDSLQARPGLCLIGDPHAGKSTAIKVLGLLLQHMEASATNAFHRKCRIGS